MTVLRLSTTTAVIGHDVRTMEGAWEIWDQITSDDHIGFLTEPEDLELQFRKHWHLATASPKLWADAYLLAFSQAAGLILVTFDRSFGSRTAECVVIG
ncbi:MAG: VapC toxin family PIN domain ribonuclease [Bryobacteraceae bacterium]